MGKPAEALLEQIADVMVTSNQECSAIALAEFDLEIDGAKEVVISNVNVNNTASTKVENCDENVDIDIGRMNDPIEERLDQVVKVANSMEGDEVSFKTVIKNSFKVETHTKCAAFAVASTKIKFKDVKGKVTIENVQATQVARAQIKKCISNVQVRIGKDTKPLRKFIEENEDWLEVTPLKGGEVAPDGQPLKSDKVCPTKQENDQFIIISIAASAGVVFLVAIILLALYMTR